MSTTYRREKKYRKSDSEIQTNFAEFWQSGAVLRRWSNTDEDLSDIMKIHHDAMSTMCFLPAKTMTDAICLALAAQSSLRRDYPSSSSLGGNSIYLARHALLELLYKLGVDHAKLKVRDDG
ncbi:hypothetical protein [Methylocystis sp.]|uniref:hypothetical protein n=1 Tax=Methylocystis sp. TaxID=1911079 RepID=UPI0027339374|nr:hypothetical protein [Methylocystis sp.]MDP3552643.1 hypothetical protein [Methylocystis sp.]